MTTYPYSISTDTPNNLVQTERLAAEIFSSNILIALESINTNADALSINFKGNISTLEQTTLDTIVGTHTGEAYKEADTVIVENEVTILEEKVKTGGHYQATAYKLVLDQVDAGEWVHLDMVWPHPISILSAEYTDKDENKDDLAQFIVAPGTVAGYLTSEVAADAHELEVSDTYLEVLEIGYYVAIGDLDLGRCIGIDLVNKLITVENNTNAIYPQYTPVKIEIRMLPCLHFSGGTVSKTLGKSKIGGSFLPAGTPLRFSYQRNDTDTSKEFIFIIDYLY